MKFSTLMKHPAVKEYTNISAGILVVLAWLALLATGLHINSSNYRAAISYGYGNWKDWLMTIASFTLTNVVLLAFLAGFLGGTCSKIIATHAFTLSEKELAKNNTDYVLFENPFISAFRGVFIFLGILSFQYISSFNDLSSINKKDSESQTKERNFDKVYYTLLDSMSDPNSKQKIKSIWEQQAHNFKESNNDSMVSEILLYQDSIAQFSKDEKNVTKKNMWESQIRSLRTLVNVPVLVDIPGMSASGYFRFAIIISLLAFICGYDPRLFTSFLKKIPLLTKSEMEKKDD
jgi:hypothetical protein